MGQLAELFLMIALFHDSSSRSSICDVDCRKRSIIILMIGIPESNMIRPDGLIMIYMFLISKDVRNPNNFVHTLISLIYVGLQITVASGKNI